MRNALLALMVLALTTWAQIISVNRERLYNVNASGDVYHLFDEQALAGDPKAGKGGAPTTQYTYGWVGAALYYPMESIVDLGVAYKLTDIFYYDVAGSDSLYVWCGDGTNWQSLIAQNTSAYMTWVGKAVDCTARYLRIRVKSPSTAITEMVLYGTAQGTPESIPTAAAHVKPTLGELMGINGFIDDDRDLLAVVGHVREYHSWMWDDGNTNVAAPAYPNNQFAWNPSAVRWTGGGWNFDDYYGNLNTRGIEVAPVFQGTPAWMFGMTAGDSLKPKALQADSTLPASYLAHADYMYQFAARFGAANISLASLRVDAQNTAKTQMKVIHYMEGWNEPDKDWKGSTGYFSPTVLAALMSADYDGHQRTMGKNVGVKNADSTMKYVMPGLAGLKLDYVKSMYFWSQSQRGGSFPADVLNFHHYCNDAGGQSGVATKGISPEADSLRQRLEAIAQYRDAWLPGKELWLSEFGWDTHPNSVYRATAVGNSNEYEMQGRWIIRAFLEIVASGFDKAEQFMLRDSWDSSPGTFATSGLVHDNYDTLFPKYQKKISWYYVNTVNKTMRNYRYDAETIDANGIHLYSFKNAQASDSVAYAIWNPNDSAAFQSVALTISTTQVNVVRLADGQALGVSNLQNVSVNSFVLDSISGRPVFVFAKLTSPSRTRLEGSHAKSLQNGEHVTVLGQRVKSADHQVLFVIPQNR